MISEFFKNQTPDTKRLMKVSFLAGLVMGIVFGGLYYYKYRLPNKHTSQHTQLTVGLA